MTWVARSSDLDSVTVNMDQNDPFDVARIMHAVSVRFRVNVFCCIC